MVSYEIAMGFALVGVLMAAGSLNLNDIVKAQSGSIFSWFVLPLFGLFLVYFISGVAEKPTVRHLMLRKGIRNRGGFPRRILRYGFRAVLLSRIRQYDFNFGFNLYAILRWLVITVSRFGFLNQYASVRRVFGNGLYWLILKAVFLFMFLLFRATFPQVIATTKSCV